MNATYDRKQRLEDLEHRRSESMAFKWQTAIAQIMRFIANNHDEKEFFVIRRKDRQIDYDVTVFLLVVETLAIINRTDVAVKFTAKPPKGDKPCFFCTTTYDSGYALERWLRYGCVEEGSGKNWCRPISPWDAEDVLAYIEAEKTKIRERGTI